VQDPRTLCLEAGSAYDDDRPLQWLPMTRPVTASRSSCRPSSSRARRRPARARRRRTGGSPTVITNGQGAAFSAEDAAAHALLEVLQRHGNAVSFRAMDQGVVVDLDGLTDPASLALLDGCAPPASTSSSSSPRPSSASSTCTRSAAPVDEAVPIAATACGEAAHPDREVAVRKALHEFAAARARKVLMHGPLDLVERATPPGYLDGWLSGHPPERLVEEDRALQAVLAWSRSRPPRSSDLLQDSVLSRRSTVRLADLPTASPDDLHADLLQRLHGDGLDVLLSVQPSAGEAVAVKALVPGLEVETMSYGRIGERGVRPAARAR
jgi:ribosomal protein S12 methylthiotransferase accessory factor